MLRSCPRIFTALRALLSALLALAQQNDIPLNRDIYYDLDLSLIHISEPTRPY